MEDGDYLSLISHQIDIEEGSPETGLVIAPDENATINAVYWYEGKAVNQFRELNTYVNWGYQGADYERAWVHRNASYVSFVDYFTDKRADPNKTSEQNAIFSINTVFDLNFNLIFYTVNELYLDDHLERYDYRKDK